MLSVIFALASACGGPPNSGTSSGTTTSATTSTRTTNSGGSSGGTSTTGQATATSGTTTAAETGSSTGRATTTGTSGGTTTGGATGGPACTSGGGGAGNPVYADCLLGADNACCGAKGSPCRTIGQAMANIEANGNLNTAIDAVYDGKTPSTNENWTATESWPVVLSENVTLVAPSLNFSGDAGILFLVTDGGSATLSGGSSYMWIGSDVSGDLPRNEIGVLANFGGSATVQNVVVGCQLNGGSQLESSCLQAGDSQSGGNLDLEGQVYVGVTPDSLPIKASGGVTGSDGILCTGPSASSPSSLTGAGTFFIAYHNSIDISVHDYCSVNLTGGGQLGVPYVAGPNACGGALPSDYHGLYVQGPATVSIDNLKVSCQYQDGVDILAYDPAGNPISTTLNNAQITYNGCNGLWAEEGNVSLGDGGLITGNQVGVLAGGMVGGGDAGSYDLVLNWGGGATVIACNEGQYTNGACSGGWSADLWLSGAGTTPTPTTSPGSTRPSRPSRAISPTPHRPAAARLSPRSPRR
ncbi:MAG: hypothetical protein ACYDCL_22035 [Myxococcales bacterium]